jgi:hypothetical protein
VKQRRVALDLAISLMLMLSLAACKSGTTPPSTDPSIPTSPSPKEIGGTIGGWIGEEGIVRWKTYNPDNGEDIVLAEAPISAEGNFSLTLPVGKVLDRELFPFEPGTFCGPDALNTIEATPSLIKLTITEGFSVYASADSDEDLGRLRFESPDPSKSLSYLYATSDATITGECVEVSAGSGGGGSSTLRFDLDLKAGWNEVVLTSAETASTVATESFPDTARWTYFGFDDSPRLSLDRLRFF